MNWIAKAKQLAPPEPELLPLAAPLMPPAFPVLPQLCEVAGGAGLKGTVKDAIKTLKTNGFHAKSIEAHIEAEGYFSLDIELLVVPHNGSLTADNLDEFVNAWMGGKL